MSKKDLPSNPSDLGGLLKEPGDRFEAFITKNKRRVAKLITDQGRSKTSVTEYENGTQVITKVKKAKK